MVRHLSLVKPQIAGTSYNLQCTYAIKKVKKYNNC